MQSVHNPIGHAVRARLGSQCGASLVVLAILGLAGCSGQSEIITPPPPPPAAFTIEFKADAEDGATAQVLGWTSGIPDVDLTLTPSDGNQGAPRTYRGSPQGTLSLTDLTAGRYTALGTRWLTETERDLLPASDDALGFVAKASLEAVSSGRMTLRLPADRKHSLVISEWAFNQGNGYSDGGFLELFNNGDTTVYLDGIIVGEGWWASLDTPTSSCSESEPYRNDPQGIWSRDFARFPGGGTDYPLAPGETAVVATDAIDHRPLVQGGLDLRGADFEFRGQSDVDNPTVPDMEDIGLLADPGGHGLDFGTALVIPFVALPTDPATLFRTRPSGGTEWGRFPGASILDAFAIAPTNPVPAFPYCRPFVHAFFDRRESRVRGTDGLQEVEFSVSRSTIPLSVGATVRLQHTRTGDADFLRSIRTPGQLP